MYEIIGYTLKAKCPIKYGDFLSMNMNGEVYPVDKPKYSFFERIVRGIGNKLHIRSFRKFHENPLDFIVGFAVSNAIASELVWVIPYKNMANKSLNADPERRGEHLEAN
jgi:hypothetical protein